MQVPKSDTPRNPDTVSSDTKSLLVKAETLSRVYISVCVHMCGCEREDGTVCGVLWDYVCGQKVDTFQHVIQYSKIF